MVTGGFVVLCLLKSRLRYTGVAMIAAAGVMASFTTRPDLFVSATGDAVAVRTAEGALTAVRFGSDAFALRDWLAADADARTPSDGTLKSGFACDAHGCVAKLADGNLVAVSRTAAALAEDCVRVALLVTIRETPPDCRATAIDRGALREAGAMTLYRDGKTFKIERSYPAGYDRPWARRTAPEPPASTSNRPAVRDATPHEDDVEAGD
jgi:competence protein ComEC